MDDPSPPQVFLRAAGGDREAMDQAMQQVYDELRRLAHAEAGRSRQEIFQPTALVHEVYLRLRNQRSGGWTDKGSFLAVAARVLRRVLVDQARARQRLRRGGDRERVDLDETRLAFSDHSLEVLEAHELLDHLGEAAPEEAQVAELILFGGLDIDATAEALQVSSSTVDRRWRFARAWLASKSAEQQRDQ